ncbi:uncharacterized protein LOC123508786 isoform X2 [Portunus trituberculatus]|uniref:uncharacterized protein LOC123508786 isoform X2 n=1 Tax=Portunus trituberculatus TaxID=210409 RepID=UPI001E1CE83D|nr:uncharacterized protein LOC123508786 isoform X2 [Portunus trituberculatus]
MATDGDEDHWRTKDTKLLSLHTHRWALAAVVGVATVAAWLAATVMATALAATPRLASADKDTAGAGVGLLQTGTPLDADLRAAFQLAARRSGAGVPLREATAADTATDVVATFTQLWEAGVRVFLAGVSATHTEALCRHLQQTGREALLVSLTDDADTPSCSSSSSSLLASVSPPPAALVATEVAALVEGGATHLQPVLMPSRAGESLLPGLRAVAAAHNVTVASPVYMDPARPSVMPLSQALDASPRTAVWLAADHHLPHLMAPLRAALYGRLVMLHAHPAHLAALFAHPAARAAAETCAVTTVQWAGPSSVDSLAHRRLMAALKPIDPLAAALAYHAATLSIDAALHGSAHTASQSKAHPPGAASRWGAEQEVRDTEEVGATPARQQAGWAARLRLVKQHLVKTMVMQDSPWLLEGMTWVHEGSGPSPWLVRGSYAPARLLTRQEMWQLGKHAGCGSLARVEVRAHDPLTNRPILNAWPVHAAPEVLLIPNFSPRGFSVKAHCPDRVRREVEVGCQGAAAHDELLKCVMVESRRARQRREVNNFITHHGVSGRKFQGRGLTYAIRKAKGFIHHPDVRAFIPQLGGCLGATGGCSYCFVFIMGSNVTVNPGVCMGACAVAVGASCSSLVAKGVEYQIAHTVICTELFAQGQLSWDSYIADAAYGARVAATNPQALRGYQLMASPLVAAMQVSPSLSSLVEVLARPWVRHMEYEEGIAEADDPVGHLMTALGLPLCSAVALLYHHILKAALIALMTTMTWCALK